jgi:hypothetical protein
LKAWRARRRRSTGCGSARGSCCWRRAGLDETGERGAEPKYTAETGKRILALLDRPPPKGYARWTGPLLEAAPGDVDIQYIWRFLRAQKIGLAGRKSWCESNDPKFVAKAADVAGLSMAPPENAIVICVDEKPSIQALERAHGYLKLPNGRALTGHIHDYKRNGTSMLFAAFEVATGKVTAAHKKRRRRVEFLDFMNGIAAAYPERASPPSSTTSTHTSPGTALAQASPQRAFPLHPGARLLEGKSLHGASFSSVEQLREHIDVFIAACNETAKAKVYQKRLKARIALQ